jgi:hypothetical protein
MAKKKETTIALIEKEEKALPKVEIDHLERAKLDFKQNNNIATVIMTTIALETSLRKTLKLKMINAEGKPFGEIIQLAANAEILNKNDVNKLREISYLRNRAVHEGQAPPVEITKLVLDISNDILKRLDLYQSTFTEKNNRQGLKLSNDVKTFIERKKPAEDIKILYIRLIQEIGKMPGGTKLVIKENVISYKCLKHFVSLELRKQRIILHLTLPKEPRIPSVAYLRVVYGVT